MTTKAPKKTPLELFNEKIAAVSAGEMPFLQQIPTDLSQHPDNIQMIVINRVLRQRLMQIEDTEGVSTLNSRYCIVDEAATSDWLRTLENGVLPQILEHR